ncbi:Serine/threonine-protein kinase HT1 [Platanthera zijinensis]|uniref:non-specific serine/threonine protein kinase n=1 Tax=Platanthera zijinensis TaxID=2320716 RepID=A0AAP0AYR7_9ASPA
MNSCFGTFCLGRKGKAGAVTPPPPLPPQARASLHNSSSSSSSSMISKRRPPPLETETMERKRWNSLESWSMLLDTGIAESSESNAGDEREEWMADLSQLFLGNKFASGSHSRIYRGIYKQRAVAVKMVKIPEKDQETRERLQKQFKSEVSFLSRLYHPNIVQFIAASRKPPVYCIITEYMSQGTLRMYLHKKEPYSLSTETILRLALDISRGMEYLHSQGVIHRDLKSHNLLLNDEMRVKVADFGTSCLETQLQDSKGNMGTYRWMAPEMIKEKPYTRKVDVYSFGIILWELTTALVPFQGMTPVQAAYAASEKFIAASRKPPVYCIITEYMSQGTLRMYLHKKEPYSLSTETILRIALDISRGMEYLHSQDVIHRDLKSHNLLLNDEMRVKVADFGTSCLETQLQDSKGNMGTYRWMAPEMIKEKPYTRKVDVYSFGIVLWELTTALIPFQGMTPVQAAYAASEKNLRPPLSTTCSPVLNNLIKNCWSVNPAKRPDFSYIVSVLEKYDACLKEGLPLLVHQDLNIRNSILGLFKVFKGCIRASTSVPVLV